MYIIKQFTFSSITVIATAVVLLTLRARATDYILPDDARVVNVRDYGAMGDGKTDDTAAIRRAIYTASERSRYASPPFVYFPAGIYLVSDSIESRVDNMGWSGGWRAGMLLMGENRDKTIIKLADRMPRFQSTKDPRAVIVTGSENDNHAKNSGDAGDGGGNRAFRHYIVNLTVDTGIGNPGAAGIDFIVSNRGSIEDVLIRSGDGSGVAGILMTRNWPGPGLIKRTEIVGFDYAVKVGSSHYSMTIEHLTIRDQKRVGIHNAANVVAIRGLRSTNSVPALVTTQATAQVTLVDSDLRGGKADATAIDVMGPTIIQRVSIAGYGTAVEDGSSADRDIPGKPAGTTIDFHLTGTMNIVGDVSAPYILPVLETPEFNSTNADDWANVEDYGATAGDGWDDADGIQAAIDSGKPIIYLPNGSYEVNRPIIIRGNVRKVMGMQSSIGPAGRFEPMIRVESSAPEGVVFEHLWLSGRLEHASKYPVTLRHLDVHKGYNNTETGTGHLFIEDTIGKPFLILHPQKVWGRQVNTEYGTDPLIENHGGDIWLLCQKTEGQMPAIATYAGGRTELMSGMILPLRGHVPPENPCFINEGGTVAYIGTYSHGEFEGFVRDGVGDDARTLTRDKAPRQTTLYVSSPEKPALTELLAEEELEPEEEGKGWQVYSYASGDYRKLLTTWQYGSAGVIRRDSSAAPGEPRTGAVHVFSGTFTPPESSTYKFRLEGTRGAYDKRLFIDGKLVMSNRDTTQRDHTGNHNGSIRLEAGKPYPVKLEVFIRNGHVWIPIAITYTDAKGTQRSSYMSNKWLLPREFEQSRVLLAVDQPEIREGAGTATVTVTREGDAAEALELGIWCRGSASRDSYSGVPATIHFAPGEKSVSFTVSAVDNDEAGGRTELLVALKGHPDYLVSGNPVAITIIDDETPAVSTGKGLRATYYEDTRYTKERLTRVDPVIDFTWTDKRPFPSENPRSAWAVRWLGSIEPTYSETYTFILEGPSSASLWINGDKVIDADGEYLMRDSGSCRLTAGMPVDIRLDVPFNGYGSVRLLWQSESQVRQVIPASQLNPDGFVGRERKSQDLNTMDINDLLDDDTLLPDAGILPEAHGRP